MISRVTYHLVAHTLIIQFRDILTEHFNLHQFGLTIHGDYETMVYGVWAMLDLHPNWVVL